MKAHVNTDIKIERIERARWFIGAQYAKDLGTCTFGRSSFLCSVTVSLKSQTFYAKGMSFYCATAGGQDI